MNIFCSRSLQAYLHKSVLDLAKCFEGVFVNQGKNSVIIHILCLLLCSMLFPVSELTRAFLFYCLILLCYWLIFQPNNGLLQLYLPHTKHSKIPKKGQHLKSAPRLVVDKKENCLMFKCSVTFEPLKMGN